MADEHLEQTTSTEADDLDATPGAPAEGERVFTQAEVGKLLAAERKRLEAKHGRTSTGNGEKPKPTSPAPRMSEADRELHQRMQQLELKYGFQLAAGEHQLTAPQRSRLERMFLAEAPEDAHAWLAETITALGLTPQHKAGTSEPPTQTSQRRQPVPIADPGGPSPQPDSDRTDNPLMWDRSQIERIMSGAKNAVDASKALRQRWMEGMTGVELTMPRGK